MKINNTAEKSIESAEKLTKALKEGYNKTLGSILNDTMSNLVKEAEEKDEEETEVVDEPAAEEVADDKDFEVEDVDENGDVVADDDSAKPEEGEEEADSEDAPEADDEAEEDETKAPAEDDADEKWSDFEAFKTDDDDYDFTTGGQEDVASQLFKIFGVMGDGDQLVVAKDGDDLTISDEDDNIVDTVKLDDEGDAESEEDVEAEEPAEGETDFDVELDGEDDAAVDSEESDDEDEDSYEFDIPDDEDELHEDTDLGYTDNYQVGKGDSQPFDEVVKESDESLEDDADLEEATNVGGAVQQRSSSKSHVPAGRKEYMPKGSRHVSAGAEYTEVVESIKAENENLKKENASIREALNNLKKNLVEAAVLNMNLGNVVKLLVNETTTKDEKKSILDRFSSVKTIKEGNELYNRIRTELNEGAKKKTNVVLERQISVDSNKSSLNETTFYQNVQNCPSIDLMKRMDNLYKDEKKRRK